VSSSHPAKRKKADRQVATSRNGRADMVKVLGCWLSVVGCRQVLVFKKLITSN